MFDHTIHMKALLMRYPVSLFSYSLLHTGSTCQGQQFSIWKTTLWVVHRHCHCVDSTDMERWVMTCFHTTTGNSKPASGLSFHATLAFYSCFFTSWTENLYLSSLLILPSKFLLMVKSQLNYNLFRKIWIAPIPSPKHHPRAQWTFSKYISKIPRSLVICAQTYHSSHVWQLPTHGFVWLILLTSSWSVREVPNVHPSKPLDYHMCS
jgi:hypothetical protein